MFSKEIRRQPRLPRLMKLVQPGSLKVFSNNKSVGVNGPRRFLPKRAWTNELCINGLPRGGLEQHKLSHHWGISADAPSKGRYLPLKWTDKWLITLVIHVAL